MKLNLISSFVLFALIGMCLASGKRDHQEECSTLESIGKLFGANADEGETCITDKSLVCLAGKCRCTPVVTVYQEGIFGAIGLGKFGGKCVGAASSPCVGENYCVDRSDCKSGFCICRDGYNSKDGFCNSGAEKKIFFGSFLLIIAAYFVFA